MVAVEVTLFDARSGDEGTFRDALAGAMPILARQPGHIGHEYGVSVERPEQVWLIVRWERLEDHTEGFRKSADFQTFTDAFREFLAKPAEVSHFVPSFAAG